MLTSLCRFGQTVLQDCEYCTTYDEFALYALPGPLLQYIREVAFLGLLTINGSHRERWRTYVVAGIVGAAVMEGYTILTYAIRVPKTGLGVFMVRSLPTVLHICP